MLFLTLAWRNLGRNRRRSFLTASAVGFATLLMVFVIGLGDGSYRQMIDTVTRMDMGQIQIQRPGYQQAPKIRNHLRDVSGILTALEGIGGVATVTARGSAFGIVAGASGEKSLGTHITGVDPARELQFSTLPGMVSAGRYLAPGAKGEAIIGAALARNLGVGPGDDLVVLGTDAEGGFAVAAPEVVGVVTSGVNELDRSLLQIQLADFQEAFALTDGAHGVVIALNDLDDMVRVRAALRLALPANQKLAVLGWDELVPELHQTIEFDRISGNFFFLLLALMVIFSIANTFIMVVFERTQEFGCTMALGATPRLVVGILQTEALLLCGLGVLVGTLLGAALVLGFQEVGIPIPAESSDYLKSLGVPDRIYPMLSGRSLWTAPLFVLPGTQVAALIPAIRLWRLEPAIAVSAR